MEVLYQMIKILDMGFHSGLFWSIFINDLHQAIEKSLVYQFADDTNLLLIGESFKKINK